MKMRKWMFTSIGVAVLFAGISSFLQAASDGAGKKTYDTYCKICHGEKGLGDGTAGKALKPTPFDFTDRESMRRFSDDYLKMVITRGKKEALVKPGKGYSPLIMPGFEKELSKAQVKSLIKMVRAIQKDKPVNLAKDEKFQSQFQTEYQLYIKKCARCHGDNAEGNGPDTQTKEKQPPFMPLPPDWRNDQRMKRYTDDILEELIEKGITEAMKKGYFTMVGFGASVKESDLPALIAYLRSFSAPPPSAAKGK